MSQSFFFLFRYISVIGILNGYMHLSGCHEIPCFTSLKFVYCEMTRFLFYKLVYRVVTYIYIYMPIAC